jgi:DNA helicase-2/ATP-dependent DNA helicase PcrA
VEQQDDLTPNQQLAVERTEGPLLVLAGPGSGKTRVITRRIARIIEQGVDPARVLAITFTNKAAGEMAERVARLLPGTRVWISTFHRFCARLLRQRAGAVGLKPNFTILDDDDQRRIIRDIIKELNYDIVTFPPQRIAERISRAKNDLLTSEAFRLAREERIGDLFDSVVVQVYPEYQRRLRESNAVDFDDLLLDVVQILNENPEIRQELDDRFRYVLVDEYQDTNLAQYRIIAGLSQNYPNLCVTGDPDQSIYGWRGARIENILRFEADYPQAAVIRLEENFRSTKSILRAADRLIAYNIRRKAKTMRTDNPEGVPVEVLRFEDARTEAEGIARAIRSAVDSGAMRWSDVAIFYRINALSREFETALTRHRVPYQLAGGFAFYDRAEVKDVLAYLRLIANPQDRPAFLRVVNVPVRGIGDKSLKRFADWAEANRLTLLEAAARAAGCPGIPRRAAQALMRFAHLIGELSDVRLESIRLLLERLLDRTGYIRPWKESSSVQDQDRLANVEELVNAAAQYDAGAGGNPTLEGFLETTALVADVDSVDGAANRATLMTLHAAKGLEFPVVYIVGVEQGLLPYQRALRADDPGEYEEERRLLFVGMTRARERLYLTRTDSRASRGRSLASIPSEFLREIGLAETAIPTLNTTWTPRSAAGAEDQSAPDYDELSQEQSVEEAGPSLETERQLATSEADARSALEVSVSENAGTTAANEIQRPPLMTGADLLAGARMRAAELPLGFAMGMSVRHPQYGLGRVVKIGGFAKNRTITVEFDDDGRSETFVAGKNPLQPVAAG